MAHRHVSSHTDPVGRSIGHARSSGGGEGGGGGGGGGQSMYAKKSSCAEVNRTDVKPRGTQSQAEGEGLRRCRLFDNAAVSKLGDTTPTDACGAARGG